MKKRIIESPAEDIEMVDESDSREDSEDEDYELGDDLFSKASSKSSNKTLTQRRNYRIKSPLHSDKNGYTSSIRNQSRESDYKGENPPPPTTSKLFQIVIMRKHARLSSCLQRTYLSLTSEDKYKTIAEIMSFICECAGFKPNLIEAYYLEESSKKLEEKGGSTMSKDDFGWDSFKNCYWELPKKVTYEDVLNHRNVEEVEESEFYGRTINFEKGESISHQFYAMCNNRMKNLTKHLEVKDGWMIDLGSAGFPRFCEFFSEMILQVEMQYFKDLILLLQWVFALSLSPYRSIRLLSCVACNEVISSLLIKLETLRKDQVVLKKQLSVEAELDKRASGRMGSTKVNLSGSTLELYKKLNLVNVTCTVISSLVKSTFYLNYSSKAFDVFTDIRVIASYYMVVHYLINPSMYENELYLDLVSNFILNEDDNLTLLLKYLLIWNKGLNYRVVDKLLEIYPNEKREVNELVEFILLKYINPDEEGVKDEDTVNKVKSIVFEDGFFEKSMVESNSVYLCGLFLVNHFPEYEFEVRFNMNLANIRSKYTYAINPSNKEYNQYVYKYNKAKSGNKPNKELNKLENKKQNKQKVDQNKNKVGRNKQKRGGIESGESELEDENKQHETQEEVEVVVEEVENIKRLVKVLLKYRDGVRFGELVENMVESLLKLRFLNVNLSCLKYENYVKFTNELEMQRMSNEIIRVTVEKVCKWILEKKEKQEKEKSGREEEGGSGESERIKNMEDFVENCQEVYKINKNNERNIYNVMEIFRCVSSFNLGNKVRLGEMVLNNFKNMLSNMRLTEQAVKILYNLMNKSKEEKATNVEKIKSKINGVFSTNMGKLISYVSSERKEVRGKDNEQQKKQGEQQEEEIKRVLFTLNQFLMSFNFIKMENKNILKIYKLENNNNNNNNNNDSSNNNNDNSNNNKLIEELKRKGISKEMMVLYYLTYEYIVYNLVNDESYNFEELGLVQDKLLNLLVETSDLEEKRVKGRSEEVFEVTSSMLNVIKLSNMDFLKKTKSELKISKRVVKEVEECVTYFLTESYRVRELKDNKEGYPKRKDKGLNLMNDGSITISNRYSRNNNNNHNNNNNDNNNYKDSINMDYMAESVTYQYIKTLNQEMYNSNVSVMIIINSCSGVERMKRASKKFVEILNKLNEKLFNLLMLHTMFTLYEMSKRVLLEEVVKVFNEFKTLEYVKVIYEIIKYIKKSQSNEKFQKYLNNIVVNNVNSKVLSKREGGNMELETWDKNNDNNNNSNNSNNSNNNNNNYENETKEDYLKCEEIETLIRYIQVNHKSGTERYDISKKIEKVLRKLKMEQKEEEEEFNANIMMLRRTLQIKKLERYCNWVEKTMLKGSRELRPNNKNKNNVKLEKDIDKEKEEKQLRKVKRSTSKDTTLVPSNEGFYNNETTNDPNEYESKLSTTNDNYNNNNNNNSNNNNKNNNTNTGKNNDNNKVEKRKRKYSKVSRMKQKEKEDEQDEYEDQERSDTEKDSPKIVRRYSKRLMGPNSELKSKGKSGKDLDLIFKRKRQQDEFETLEEDNEGSFEFSDFEGEVDLRDF